MEVQAILQLIYLGVLVGGLLILFRKAPISEAVKGIVETLAIIVIILWAIKWLMGHAH